MYSVDASRRTTAANAYVTGLGPSKRVVLFDTLLDRYSGDEVRRWSPTSSGHVRHRDVPPQPPRTPRPWLPAAALAVQRLSWALSPERGTPASLPRAGLAAAWCPPVGLIGNRLSRAVERRADPFSLK